ncbi:PAS domain-containing protein [Pelagibius litoralis]|uniref:histidine kinase n=1 Tax=Pelagibius litoralis TaxID=374515 RepID=A0A967EWL6_9PROT|nr:ATP-binding protein [Pelagibius litoralis]NIA67353.1 PAS domain-containing protein [Pelagibius litoralis]
MAKVTKIFARGDDAQGDRDGHLPDSSAVLSALAVPLFVVDATGCISFVNQAAEQFFASSRNSLIGRPLLDLLSEDSPVVGLIHQARAGEQSISETGVTLTGPKIGSHFVSIDAAVMADFPGSVVVSINERSIARKIDHQLVHRSAARSVTAMAAMLAHEVKNPLSGIRGAAQLLEQNADPEDHQLTRLICEEADRIVALVDRMEMFSDQRPLAREAVNIHIVLEHVRRLAENGFARHLRFVESYDPSLPPVYGNRDLLIQAILNLVKNAAEAAPLEGGEITLSTRYQQGVRLAVPGSGSRIDLPLMLIVQDNGPGIPEDLQQHLFDPFVTTKAGGSGLGLALVAKTIGDHGGVIEFDSEPRRTSFRVMLPMAPSDSLAPAENAEAPAG